MTLLKKSVARKFGFVILRFDPLKQLNSFTTVVTVSGLGGAEVTH